MELTRVPVNIFILGDLVLDHFIPVTAKQRPFQAVGSERVFEGHPRRTIPGGAANCARLIASLGRGRTCLWGLSGHSPWGSFVQILEKSHLSERPDRGVIYHGSHNESHQMNTITRLVSIDKDGIRHREFRVDDVSYFPTTEGQRREALAYLQAEDQEHGVHAILLNDLDMKALTEPLVRDIGEFAQVNTIPIFVDPKRDWHKYRGIHVTCALPNLKEWCHIVENADHEHTWRSNIAQGQLESMAVRCLRYMPNVDFHLIKCDELGAVLIAPAGAGRREIRHIEPHPTRTTRLPGQLGAGDMLAAALGMEFAALTHETNSTDRMMKALEKALAVVACYLEMDWQEVPSERQIKFFQLEGIRVLHRATVPGSVLLLPERQIVDLDKLSVENSALVSIDPNYHRSIEGVIKLLVDGWEKSDCLSAIVTGRGGVGKSELISILKNFLKELKVFVWDEFNPSEPKTIDSALIYIRQKLNTLDAETKGVLVIMDEAFSRAGHLLFGENGKNLLQAGADCKPMTRFLFIDADFERHRSQLSLSQFVTRCEKFTIPELSSRHGDIPYIFAAACLKYLNAFSVKISESVLLGMINWVLTTPEMEQSSREISKKAREIITKFKTNPIRQVGIAEISRRHLPTDLKDGLEETDSPREFFQFSRSEHYNKWES